MSEGDKKVTVGESLASIIKMGGRVTDWAVIQSLFKPDFDSLPFLTEINCPVEMAVADTLNVRALKYGVTCLDSFLLWLRVNYCADHRKRVKEVIEGWVSVSLQNLIKGEGVTDKLFGERK